LLFKDNRRTAESEICDPLAYTRRMSAKSTISLPAGVKVPDHVAIIPDGDRRWARARGKTPMEGHYQGTQRLVEVARAARQMGIHTVTAWGLSTENWLERPKPEVDFLFKAIAEQLRLHVKEAKRDGAKIVHLGRKDRMPEWFVEELRQAEEYTKEGKKHIVNLALDYNGRDELMRAVNKALHLVVQAKGDLKTKKDELEITREVVEASLDTAGQPYPYPDLMIRTSGEQRTSGLLMWQAEYAEFYFEQDNFPDFTVEKFTNAILDYSRRRRRFGGNDAVSHMGFRPEVVAKLELAWWRMQENSGEHLSELVVKHLREQFGLSAALAKETAGYLIEAMLEGKRGRNWDKAKQNMVKFYELVKQELGYAFEPKLVAGFEVRWQKETEKEGADAGSLMELEDAAKNLYAEVYRISLLQAAKAAHLRALAAIEKRIAMSGIGDPTPHWNKAEDYLVRFYSALKERVA